MAKVYSVFLCVLLISVLFFPLTSAGRVLLDKPQKADDVSGKHSNGGNKIGVEGSYSSPDHSARGHASPFHANPVDFVNPTVTGPKGTAYNDNLRCEGLNCERPVKCDPTKFRGCR